MSAPECTGCPVATRREFLRDAGISVVSVLAALGIARSAGAMLPETFSIRPIAELNRRGALRTYPIPAGDGAQIDRGNQLILVRWHGSMYAFNLSCPHQNTALKWDDGEHRFQCPKHHSRYQPDGTFIEGRATRGMDRLDIRREGETVVVDPDKWHKQDTDPAGWNAAVVTNL
jgi:Rieske Fe-S protein